ncbi:hypothetical protein K3556_03720 [Aliiroseovarius sp. M344]|uniref:hypothetical protein n=1 Tax=Aliiroseovarius sp. M344 TaxID=2867010 RepID=UPI0021AE022D|nr:hypothetical protein [Aliiroseovarius sp. M344]UWQ15016.1 hypothetical protein K3556_03720 [Aliiroseovarius sp. M344]
MRSFCVGFLCVASPVFAHEAVIEGATATPSGAGWSISVTLAHDETGWDDYADGWRVENQAGDTLGTRVLQHPHANEQPFTRSLPSVALPEGAEAVWIRARTSVDGWGKERFRLDLPVQ